MEVEEGVTTTQKREATEKTDLFRRPSATRNDVTHSDVRPSCGCSCDFDFSIFCSFFFFAASLVLFFFAPQLNLLINQDEEHRLQLLW